jgi:hypothetical protein|tara:strand:- start:44 stop:502 length:459 start_codon:yes stop_codon:yes gene_type:complete
MPLPAALIAAAAGLGIKNAAKYGLKELSKLVAKHQRSVFKKTKPYFKKKRAEKAKKKETAKQTRAAKRSIREESNERLMHAGSKYSSIRTKKAASESRKIQKDEAQFLIEKQGKKPTAKFLKKVRDEGYVVPKNWTKKLKAKAHGLAIKKLK